MPDRPDKTLRRGWTTGACATAASRAAYTALLTGEFPDPVSIVLPRGERPAFALATQRLGADAATAGIVKDAGDDPDVTHGALIEATVRRGLAGSGVQFAAGVGVGTVTLAGLPIAVGEPAINPVPRQMMRDAIAQVAAAHDAAGDVEIRIDIPDGAHLAERTWNPRLGILGGLSVLGTTGIVVPYSCSAWIHSIHRGIDVARAAGLAHVAGCTGATSERAVQTRYGMPDIAMLDMGDFAGGLLKYLRRHPVPRLTIGGGFGKLTKLAQGHLDLHSGRSQVSMAWLADAMADRGAQPATVAAARAAPSAGAVLQMAMAAELPIGDHVARAARAAATGVLRDAPIEVDVLVFDRGGMLVGQADARAG